MAAVVRTLESVVIDKPTTWFLDKQTAVHVLNSKASKSPEIKEMLQRAIKALGSVDIKFEYIRGAENPTDAGSREDQLSAKQAKTKAIKAEENRHERPENFKNA